MGVVGSRRGILRTARQRVVQVKWVAFIWQQQLEWEIERPSHMQMYTGLGGRVQATRRPVSGSPINESWFDGYTDATHIVPFLAARRSYRDLRVQDMFASYISSSDIGFCSLYTYHMPCCGVEQAFQGVEMSKSSWDPVASRAHVPSGASRLIPPK